MIFSDEDAFKTSGEFNLDAMYETILSRLAEDYGIEAIILSSLDEVDGNINIIASYNITTAVFSSSKKEVFSETITECFKKYPKPHIHSITHNLIEILKSIEPSKSFTGMIFIPLLHLSHKLVLLGLLTRKEFKNIPEGIYSDLDLAIQEIDMMVQYSAMKSNLSILQDYVKEVGHDIASSVQSTISKLNNISSGEYSGVQAQKKAKEAEVEILGVYRIAENLGFAVDPNYNIHEGAYFNIIESAKNIAVQYESEAAERHIRIDVVSDSTDLIVWGDKRGIESAMGQYLINAIKYSYGSGYIKIIVDLNKDRRGHVLVSVSDKGIPIYNDEKPYIWNFGYRGKNALERHVNGAGIGLFTVKKIIEAHSGKFWVTQSNASGFSIVTFSFSIPQTDILKKSKLLK
jgi:signal transduction histidine kinase